MKKILLRLWLFTTVIGLGYLGYWYYNKYQDDLAYEEYLANIVDTASPNVFSIRDSVTITYRNEKRTVHIYLPPDYATDTLKRYPVMYMLDGESSFNEKENMAPEWQIDEVIDTSHLNGGPTAIVIGIEQAENRDAEYTPWVNDDNPDAHGEQFGDWLANEFKPWIDSTFRTQSAATATTVGGVSRSGMMAYYLAMAHPEAFGNALIQSPAMWVDEERLLAMELTPEQLKDKKFFITVGEYEGRIMIPNAENIYKKFQALGLDENHVRYEWIMGESHWHPTWRKSFAMTYPWFMK